MKCLIDAYSKEALERIVQTSYSMAELSKKLGYQTTHGKNYETILKRINDFNISVAHFAPSRAKKTLNDENVFCKNSNASQTTVRKFYLKRNDVEYKCSKCGVSGIWNDRPLVLQLDHIDGDNKNNSLNNLRWLCPNCHSQTKTFAGKNITKERKYQYCIDCGTKISSGSLRCLECNGKKRRKHKRPTKDELFHALQIHKGNFTRIARVYNVTDNAVRKWCKKYGLATHSSSYAANKQRTDIKTKREQAKACYMIDKTTNEILMEFSSHNAAGKYIAPNSKNASVHIGSVCNGKRKSAYGYYWKDKANAIS